MTTASDHVGLVAPSRPDPMRWRAAVFVLVAMALDLIDTSIVVVALPGLQEHLHASGAALQWVVEAYTLTFALCLVTAGRIGDMLGRKRVLIVGIVLFVAASATCGAAQSASMLIVSRVFQGLGGALVVTQGLSTFQVSFPEKERARVFGLFGALSGMASVLGPVLGGLLINANLFGWAWRPIFLINLPVGLVALAGVARYVRESKAPDTRRLDVVGVVLVTAALLAVLYPLVQGRELGWPAWTFASMAASVPLFAVFAFHERAKQRRDGFALVQPALFGRRTFTAGLVLLLFFFAGVAGFFFPFTFYLQKGLGFSAFGAGMAVVPYSIGAMATSSFSPLAAKRLGRIVLNAGIVVMMAGTVGMILTINHYGASTSTLVLVPSLVVVGLGMGLVASPMVELVLSEVPHRDAGSASGILNTANQLGAAAGVAVLGVLFFGMLGSEALPGTEREVKEGFSHALSHVLWYETGILGVALLLTFLLPGRLRPQGEAAEQGETSPAP
ncbi:MFS transporter [Kitasatospora sp. GP82]|uniref:MFS transporter n=1 Tax=Kitasatospora sp. GP82 TaxID=3035089 RepID=UPI00247393DD|nr:MFS transporter [Kitasatospora sp. GP82]MDH6129120.1 EmrB/QacA subfamily drug resistance transporter [Kitasatospora sp. GP82]